MTHSLVTHGEWRILNQDHLNKEYIMATSLADIRARIAAQEQKTNTKSSSGSTDNLTYPHWNIDEGATASVRFLPDGDVNNPYFWVEKNIIKLPFNGVKGDTAAKRVEVQVPCIEMFGPEFHCPILAEVRPWYKDETLKELANKYWKKRSYIFQGFVRINPLADDKTPENPIRKLIISPQIIPLIKAGLMDPEIMELPTDYLRGLDFNIKKTTKGGYADYSTSNWSRRETPLTEAEQAAIAQFGLFTLSSFLPKMPSEAELRIIKEMFDASVDGKAYDNDRWGQYYRPWGLDAPKNGQAPVAQPAAPVAQTATTEDAPWEDEPTAAVAPVVRPSAPQSDKAQDILAMIRARQKTA
jgi:hypothetical protein